MPKGPNSDDVNDDVNGDATDDAVDDVTDDVTDDAVDDTADDADNTDQDTDQSDTSQGQGGKPNPKTRQPTTRSEPNNDPAAGLKKALTAERQRARQLDKDLKELQRKHASAEERQLMEAKEQATTEAEARVKAPLIKALAASELKAANVQGTNIPKLVRLLDLEKVEIADDGELEGLVDQIEELKTEFPNLFAAATNGTTKVPNVNSGTGNGRSKDNQDRQPPKGFAQILAEQVMAAVPPGQGVASR